MFQRVGWLTMVLMAVVSVSLATWANGDSGKGKKAGKVEGTLIGVASNGVVIQTKSGTQVSVAVDATTKVELNEVKVVAGTDLTTVLTVGANAEAEYDLATMIASKLEVE